MADDAKLIFNINQGNRILAEAYGCVLRRIRPLLIIAVIGMFVVNACIIGKPNRLPPVTDPATETYRIGKFVWFDLLTESTVIAKAFYGALFRWKFEKSKVYPDYFVILNNGQPIGGIIRHADEDPEVKESLWIGSLSVPDVDGAVALIRKYGGQVLDGPMNEKARGRMAVVRDPAGAALVLLRAAGGDPIDTPPITDGWLWTDLFTRDAQAAKDFYTALVGFEAEIIKVGEDHVFHVFKRDGRPCAGVVEVQWEGLQANWLPYVKVDNIDRTVDLARQLGGQLILRVDDVAILADPNGAAIGIQKHAKAGKGGSS